MFLLAHIGGFAADVGEKERFLEGMQPSKPPACVYKRRTHNDW
jgi:hypothetical protein